MPTPSRRPARPSTPPRLAHPTSALRRGDFHPDEIPRSGAPDPPGSGPQACDTGPMDRTLFAEEHQAFRQSFRSFIDREIRPHQERWRDAGQVDREAWRKAGAGGFLCPWLPEAYGGAGGDFLHSVVVMEEL